MHPAQVHTAKNGDKIHGRELEPGDVLAPGDLYPWHGGWRYSTLRAGSPLDVGVAHRYVRPTAPGTFLSSDGLTYVVGGGGTFTAHGPDMVPHPDGGEPLRGRKLLPGDVVQKGDRCSTEAGWWPVDWSIVLGCAPGESARTFVRPAPEPELPDGAIEHASAPVCYPAPVLALLARVQREARREGDQWIITCGLMNELKRTRAAASTSGDTRSVRDLLVERFPGAVFVTVPEPVITYCWAVDSACRTHLVECRDGEPYRSRKVGDDHWGVYRMCRDSFEFVGPAFEL